MTLSSSTIPLWNSWSRMQSDVHSAWYSGQKIVYFSRLLSSAPDGNMQCGDRVLVAQMNWNGMLEGAVYGFVEDPEEGWSPIECRLELLKISDETYTDAGHAIEWCIKNAH